MIQLGLTLEVCNRAKGWRGGDGLLSVVGRVALGCIDQLPTIISSTWPPGEMGISIELGRLGLALRLVHLSTRDPRTPSAWRGSLRPHLEQL